MTTPTNPTTSTETTMPAEFELATQLQTPSIPLDFVEYHLVGETGSFLIQWLMGQNIPDDVIKLFHCLCFFELYRHETAKHNGAVPGDLNQAAPEYLVETLALLHKLGYRY